MARGNPDNLRAAAVRKREHATERARDRAARLDQARRPDHLPRRRHRGRLLTGLPLQLAHAPAPDRASPRPTTSHTTVQASSAATDGPATSNVVRALSAQLTALKKQHHDELVALNAALTAAHGELLQLRRQLGQAGLHAARPTG